jgi:hypothetical protein
MVYGIELQNGQFINLLQSDVTMGYSVDDPLVKEYPDNPYPAHFTLVVKNPNIEYDYMASAFDENTPVIIDSSTATTPVRDYLFSVTNEVAKQTTNMLFMMTYTQADEYKDTPLSTMSVLKIIHEFIKDCRTRDSGNQLVLLTDRFELMDYYTTPQTVWLYNQSECYALSEFDRIEDFRNNMAKAYFHGRFGGF